MRTASWDDLKVGDVILVTKSTQLVPVQSETGIKLQAIEDNTLYGYPLRIVAKQLPYYLVAIAPPNCPFRKTILDVRRQHQFVYATADYLAAFKE